MAGSQRPAPGPIAKNAREEKLKARSSVRLPGPERERRQPDPASDAKDARYHEEMAKLYAQHVLKEPPTLKIQGLGVKKKASAPAEVLHKPVV